MRSKGVALWVALAVLLGIAWWWLHKKDTARRVQVEEQVLVGISQRMPGRLVQFYRDNQRLARAGDEAEVLMTKLPEYVKLWRLKDNGVLEIDVRHPNRKNRSTTLTMVPVVQSKHAGLSYVFAGELPRSFQLTQGSWVFLNDADIATQLNLNAERMLDGLAEPGKPARRLGVVLAAEGSAERRCSNSRPLLCGAVGRPPQLTNQAYLGTDFERLLEADNACTNAFGKEWKLWRKNASIAWRKDPTLQQEAWIFDNSNNSTNCWAWAGTVGLQ